MAFPAYKSQIECQLEITELTPKALFIEGNYLSVFGTDYLNWETYTKIKIYEISNKAKPLKVEAMVRLRCRKTINNMVIHIQIPIYLQRS